MIPLGILSSLRGPSAPEEPTGIRLVQRWPVTSPGVRATGPATTPGNLLVVNAIHRQGSSGRQAIIADDAGNVWQQIAVVPAGGSGDVGMWYCEGAKSTAALNVVFDTLDDARYISVVEWEGIKKSGALIDHASLANAAQVGNLPVAEVDNNVSGALVTGTLGATVSNRTIVLTEGSLQAGYVPGLEHKASQSTLISAARIGTPVGRHGPQWTLSGSSSTTGVITAAFSPA